MKSTHYPPLPPQTFDPIRPPHPSLAYNNQPRESTPSSAPIPRPPSRLLDQVRFTLRLKHYSLRTEKSYLHWIRRFILFHDKRHPRDMGSREIEAFLTDLALNRKVAAATQNQALSALLFLYRHILGQDLDLPINAVRARRPKRLPTVLSKGEVTQLIACLSSPYQLMAKLLYGSGLRLTECLRLRINEVPLPLAGGP